MNEIVNEKINRILVTRTDRIGDVVLSTPVIEALRLQFPKAVISMMVSPLTQNLIQGNPFLDEVIVYDKQEGQKSWKGTWSFARDLRRKRFDIAIHLHPNNRSHWVSYLAKIPIRLGYKYKNYRLLTHVVPHLKQEGKKHEAEYNFDLLRVLDIQCPSKLNTRVVVQDRAQVEWNRIKSQLGLEEKKYIAINPGASCPSKMWAPSHFAALADYVIKNKNIPIAFIGSHQEHVLVKQIKEWVQSDIVDLTEKLKLSESVCAIKDAKMLISNDSGPVHIACALDTPVISIFGRNQAGLSPLRWGPLGEKSKVLHKDVGCDICWAHECPYSFACLDAITVEEVIKAIEAFEAYTYC